MSTPIIRTLAAGGRSGTKLATVICDLVVKGAPLGELDEWVRDPTNPDPAALIKRQCMPREWLDRLDKAIETGAFDLIPADRIVDIILQGQQR